MHFNVYGPAILSGIIHSARAQCQPPASGSSEFQPQPPTLSVPTINHRTPYTIGPPAQSFPHQVPEYLFKVHRNPETLVLTEICPWFRTFISQPPRLEVELERKGNPTDVAQVSRPTAP